MVELYPNVPRIKKSKRTKPFQSGETPVIILSEDEDLLPYVQKRNRKLAG